MHGCVEICEYDQDISGVGPITSQIAAKIVLKHNAESAIFVTCEITINNLTCGITIYNLTCEITIYNLTCEITINNLM